MNKELTYDIIQAGKAKYPELWKELVTLEYEITHGFNTSKEGEKRLIKLRDIIYSG